MTSQHEPTPPAGDPDSIYRAPASRTGFAPQGDSLAAYVGPKNAEFYSRLFDRFKTQNSTVSWNWPAFVVTGFWLLYRKMWLNALLYWFALPIVLTLLSVAVSFAAGEVAGNIFYYATYLSISLLLVPMFANWIYYRHAQGKVGKVASVTASAEQQAAELARIGGTSSVVLVVIPFVGIAIVGILAAIAIPAYQDYTIRAQVAEGLNLASGAKAAVAKTYVATGAFAMDNESAGLDAADAISGMYVSSIAIDRGVIVITYGNQALPVIHGDTILLEPVPEGEEMLRWTCTSPAIAPKHLPASCRR